MNYIVLLLLTNLVANSTSYESIRQDLVRELTEYRSETQRYFC